MTCSAAGRRAGLTLVELLVVLIMTVMLMTALGYAFSAEVTLQRLTASRRASADDAPAVEARITQMIEGAKLSAATTDTTTFFQGLTESGASNLGCDRLTLTTTAPGVPQAAMASSDDFETQQSARGPVGGVAEISLSMNAVGNPGVKSGLFERIQRPSDGDPTQGGTEFVLSDRIGNIGFQFWDGLEWVAAWDTTTGTTGAHRLPAAVMVSYTLKNDPENVTHVFVAPVPASDVTPQNPAQNGSAT